TSASGETLTDEGVLTLVADGPLDPSDYSGAIHHIAYEGPVWRAAEHGALDATCTQDPDSWTHADEVPIPGGEQPGEPQTPAWDVPNWAQTSSGATVLNLGHVDVASLVTAGALDTKIKDTTDEGVANATSDDASWHEPEE